MRLLVAIAMVALPALPLAAQDSAPVKPDSIRASRDSAAAAPDSSLKPSASGALIKSLLLPGLGQLGLGRELTAALFIAVEAGAVAMVVKSQRDLDAAENAAVPDPALIDQRKRRREDWLVVLGINHVASAIEAFVSAHMWDFPADLEIRALPAGGVGVTGRLPLRVR